MTSSSAWRIDGDAAHLALGPLAGVANLARPGLGLHDLRLTLAERGQRPLPTSSLFALTIGDEKSSWPARSDSFVRGNDLVVTYPQTASHPFRIQMYWRAGLDAHRDCLATVDVQVSVETSLLDAWPEIALHTQLPSRDVVPIEPSPPDAGPAQEVPSGVAAGSTRFRGGCSLWHLPEVEMAYVEMVHPDDVDWDRLSERASGQWNLTHRLFARNLEKGVILRARARGVFLSPAGDAAARAYERFLAAPLPLTA